MSAALDRAAHLRRRVLDSLRAGDPRGAWRRCGVLIEESDRAARRAAHLRRVAAHILRLAERHGPIAGPVRPGQRPTSYTLDHVNALLGETTL